MNSLYTFKDFKITAKKVDQLPGGGLILEGPSVTIDLPFQSKRIYRHGWQSWSLTAWIDPSVPPVPISAPEFRTKDEDPAYASNKQHIGAWLGAIEIPENNPLKSSDHFVLLLGGLDLAARLELTGSKIHGFYETGNGKWFADISTETQVFAHYRSLLGERLGCQKVKESPRVWCSWYSLYNFVNEGVIDKVLLKLKDLPFDVIQLDDGWQITAGDWDANKKFPSGMAALADKINATGRTPGLWLAPLMVTRKSSIYQDHPNWLLRDEQNNLISVGLGWNGRTFALDTSHPEVLEWLDALIRRVRSWGYGYLKLDFLYAGAFPGKRHKETPRESAYRQALRIMREAAGNSYLLACGAPIIPSLGLCDGIRIGPDVTPYWLNKPMSLYLNNPNHPSTQNAIRTSLHRLWLNPLVNTDPDVIYFRSQYNGLKPEQKSFLRDLGAISGFKANSDLPQWLKPNELEDLRTFLETKPRIKRLGRYKFCINGHEVNYESMIPLPEPVQYPVQLAMLLGMFYMAFYEVVPAIISSTLYKK